MTSTWVFRTSAVHCQHQEQTYCLVVCSYNFSNLEKVVHKGFTKSAKVYFLIDSSNWSLQLVSNWECHFRWPINSCSCLVWVWVCRFCNFAHERDFVSTNNEQGKQWGRHDSLLSIEWVSCPSRAMQFGCLDPRVCAHDPHPVDWTNEGLESVQVASVAQSSAQNYGKEHWLSILFERQNRTLFRQTLSPKRHFPQRYSYLSGSTPVSVQVRVQPTRNRTKTSERNPQSFFLHRHTGQDTLRTAQSIRSRKNPNDQDSR